MFPTSVFTAFKASLIFVLPVPPRSFTVTEPFSPTTTASLPNTAFKESAVFFTESATFATVVATECNWLPLIASLEFADTSPLATLVTFVLFALIPSFVTNCLPSTAIPLPSTLVVPIVTLFNVRSSFTATVYTG